MRGLMRAPLQECHVRMARLFLSLSIRQKRQSMRVRSLKLDIFVYFCDIVCMGFCLRNEIIRSHMDLSITLHGVNVLLAGAWRCDNSICRESFLFNLIGISISILYSWIQSNFFVVLGSEFFSDITYWFVWWMIWSIKWLDMLPLQWRWCEV